MKTKIVKTLVVLAATLAACGGTPAKRVLLIGSDGMSAAVLRRSAEMAPTLRGLMALGSWSLKARTLLPSSRAANWASMFQCSGPEQNGYNEWNSRKPIMPPAAVDANGRFPDIFYRFRAARPNAKIGYAYGWQGMPFVVDTNVCDFVVQTNAAQKVVLEFDESLINPVLDQFGEDVAVRRVRKGVLKASVSVQVSPTFFGWLAQFPGKMKILSPDELQKKYLEHLSAAGCCPADDRGGSV